MTDIGLYPSSTARNITTHETQDKMAPRRLGLFRQLVLCCAGLGASEAFVLPGTGTTGRPAATATTTRLDATALIVQNKGGGHGELGEYPVLLW